MPVSSAMSPTAKLMLPVQSIVAWSAPTVVAQLEVRPDRAEETEGHRDEEHQAPLERGQHAAEDEAEEGAADGGDAVDAQGEAPFVGGERVGDDGVGVGEEEGATDALAHAHDDDPERGGGARHPRDRQQDREDREDGEAQRVHPHPTEDVAHATEAHHEHGGHEQEAHQDPEEVRGVAGREGIELDAAKDVGQGDEQDRTIDGGHEYADGRVGQRDPLVVQGPAFLGPSFRSTSWISLRTGAQRPPPGYR